MADGRSDREDWQAFARRHDAFEMSRLIARLILAMLILPVSAAIFLFGFAAVLSTGTGGPPSVLNLTLLYGFLYTFGGAYWILLWRRPVHARATRHGPPRPGRGEPRTGVSGAAPARGYRRGGGNSCSSRGSWLGMMMSAISR